jgi:hypothetical protein
VHVHSAHSDPIGRSGPLLSCFNTEIYNSEVPRAELAALGRTFRAPGRRTPLPVMTASEDDALRQVMADSVRPARGEADIAVRR